jgi:hypothetical protein
MKPPFPIKPSWRWGTAEGSRDFDRLLDRSLTFREKLEWLEEAETLSLRMGAGREKGKGERSETGNRKPEA